MKGKKTALENKFVEAAGKASSGSVKKKAAWRTIKTKNRHDSRCSSLFHMYIGLILVLGYLHDFRLRQRHP
jgi:hypothetical protein